MVRTINMTTRVGEILGVAIGYAPVVNAAVLSMYCHVTDVAMLALVAVCAVVAAAPVWSKCVHTPTNQSAP